MTEAYQANLAPLTQLETYSFPVTGLGRGKLELELEA